MKTYTVQPGDSLFRIAQTHYGDGHLYTQLAAYNQLADPNALEVGHVLKIPPLEQLQADDRSLQSWHNYGNGSIYWRVTEKGVEIQGEGIVKKAASTQQAERIWSAYRQPILAASQQHGVPVPVIIATIATESSGKPEAYRYEPAFYDRYLKDRPPWTENPYYSEPKRISASYGLMQIMYTTAYNVGFRGKPEDLYDPATAIDVSSAYIASAFQRKQHHWDPPKIACAYNAGSVRPTRKNTWGMFFHPGHLDRWIPAYNGAIEVIGPEHAEEPSPPEPVASEVEFAPPVSTGEPQSTDLATLHLVVPHPSTGTWSPIIVDLFRHTDQGMAEPISTTISTPTVTPNQEYAYDIAELVPGVYDLVFADATSGSVLYDLTDYELNAPRTTLDLRGHLHPGTSRALPDRVNIVFQFAHVPGQVWHPLIIEARRHMVDGSLGEPVSHTIKIPSYGPDGGYIYELSNLEPGVYNFVFTDATSSRVLQEITGYIVDENPEIIDLHKTRGLYPLPESLPEQGEGTTVLTRLWRTFLSLFSGK